MKNKTGLLPRLCLTALLAAWVCCAAHCQEPETEVKRPVTSSFMLEAGASSILDTYLSPIKNTGAHVRLEYERLQAMRFNPENWLMQLDAGVDYDNVTNPVGNHTEHSLMADFRWGMMRRWQNVYNRHRLKPFECMCRTSPSTTVFIPCLKVLLGLAQTVIGAIE